MTAFQQEGRIKVQGGKVWYGVVGFFEGNQPPLIVVHGGPGMSHNYLLSLKDVSKNRAVIFYDQLDAGKSDKPDDPDNWNLPRFLDEINCICAELSIEKFSLFGNSWGGTVAAAYAAQKPFGLNKLILSSPLIKTSVWVEDNELHRSNLPIEIKIILETCENNGDTGSEAYMNAVDQFYKKHFCRVNPWPDGLVQTMNLLNVNCYQKMWGPTEFMCTGLLKNYDGSKDLYKIEVPTLVTCGKFDEATPQSTEKFSKMIPGSEFKVFQESSHLAFIEEQNAYMSAINNFLN